MMAFERLEPFGAHYDDFRFGQVCAAVYNIQLPAGSRVSARDFFNTLTPPPVDLTAMSPEAAEKFLDATLFGVK